MIDPEISQAHTADQPTVQRRRATEHRLSSGSYFSCYSYFSLLLCCVSTFHFFFLKMPYLDYFFTEKCLLHSKILQIIPHSLIFYELNA